MKDASVWFSRMVHAENEQQRGLGFRCAGEFVARLRSEPSLSLVLGVNQGKSCVFTKETYANSLLNLRRYAWITFMTSVCLSLATARGADPTISPPKTVAFR